MRWDKKREEKTTKMQDKIRWGEMRLHMIRWDKRREDDKDTR